MVFFGNVSNTLTAVSNVSCFCWHQKAEAGKPNCVAGKHQSHSHGSKYLEEMMLGVALFVYFLEWYGGRRE